MRAGHSGRRAGQSCSSRCNRVGLALWAGVAVLAGLLALAGGSTPPALDSGTATLTPHAGGGAAGDRR